MTNPNTSPHPTIDKNGKQTTVHRKNVDAESSPARPIPSPRRLPGDMADDNLVEIGSHDDVVDDSRVEHRSLPLVLNRAEEIMATFVKDSLLPKIAERGIRIPHGEPTVTARVEDGSVAIAVGFDFDPNYDYDHFEQAERIIFTEALNIIIANLESGRKVG